MRPRGWSEERTCPWCQEPFTAHGWMGDKRYCSQRCANKAKAIVCTHYAAMGRKGRLAAQANQDARWAEKIAGLSPLEAYKLGRKDGGSQRGSLEKGRIRRGRANRQMSRVA